jgi:Flp pilus assembly pilin Flp
LRGAQEGISAARDLRKGTGMSSLVRLAGRFLAEEDGLETVEYAVMAALVVGGTALSIAALGTSVKNRMDTISEVVEVHGP